MIKDEAEEGKKKKLHLNSDFNNIGFTSETFLIIFRNREKSGVRDVGKGRRHKEDREMNDGKN